MNIVFKVKSSLKNDNPNVCTISDSFDNGTLEGILAIEEIVLDNVSEMITIFWKFEDEPDEKYREVTFY